MKLTNKKLESTLSRLAKAERVAFELHAAIAAHCIEVYGVEPGDVDNDQFIDNPEMSAVEFDKTMREAMEICGVAMPNAGVRGERSESRSTEMLGVERNGHADIHGKTENAKANGTRHSA